MHTEAHQQDWSWYTYLQEIRALSFSGR